MASQTLKDGSSILYVMRVIAIIPAYNEEETIGDVIKETKKYVGKYIEKILVIDDGSQDKTSQIVNQLGVDLVVHPINRGYGAAQRTGHEIAMMEGYDYILQLDADGQHDPKYIPILLEEAKKENWDIILGSRFLNDSHKKYSFARKMGIKFFTGVVNMFANTNLTDVTSGFKVYKTESLKKLSPYSDKHPAVEQILEAAKKDFKIKEVSVVMSTRKRGESHLNLENFILYPLRAIEAILKVLIFRR